MARRKPKGPASYGEVAKGYIMVPKRGPIDRTSAARDARLAASAAAAKAKQKAAKKSVSKPVPLGGVKQGSVPAKNTGGAEKRSWGGWSPPKKVSARKKTAGGVAKRSTQGRRSSRG